MIPVLILAAGASSRMRGRDKLMEDVHGQPLLRHQILLASPVGPVFVALPSQGHPRETALLHSHAVPIYVPSSAEGIGGTLRGAVKNLPECTAFMIILADLISLETKDLEGVVQSKSVHPNHLIWRAATADGLAGHPIIFDARLRPEFENLSGDTGAAEILKSHRHQTYLHRLQDNRARHDLDTPEDWNAWRQSLA